MNKPALSDAPEPAMSDGYAFGSARYAWMVMLILCGLQFVSNMERQILGLMVEPLRRDFHILDIDVALLQGFAFALFYAIVAIPIGWLADRWRRNRIIMLGMTLWVLSTIGCMVAQSYSMLFCARLMIGLADASLVPASFSLLSDYFPKAKLAGAVGTVTGATFLGTGASLSVGGLVLGVLPIEQAYALPFGLGIIHGWQLLFGIMGVPGALLLLAMLAVREPPRRNLGDTASPVTKLGPGAIVRYFITHFYYLGPLIAGLVLLTSYQYGVTNWAVTLFIRRYGWTATQIGLLYGLYFMVIGTIASMVGGRLADYLRRRGRSDANFLVPSYAIVALIPLAIVFSLSSNALVSAVLLGAVTFLVVMSVGPAMAAIPAFVDSSLRAQFVALTMMLCTLLGSGGGPWLVAFFTQAVFHDPLALPWSLAICAGLLLVPCLLCFFLGARAARGLSYLR
jgi:MFS family permease